MMRVVLNAVVGASIVSALPVWFGNTAIGAEKADAQPITVTMKSMSFDPKKLEVSIGDSVVWSNGAHTTHTATCDDDGKTFDTAEVGPGKSSTPVKFDKEGEFKYHCKIHGKSMSGTIVVKAPEKKSRVAEHD